MRVAAAREGDRYRVGRGGHAHSTEATRPTQPWATSGAQGEKVSVARPVRRSLPSRTVTNSVPPQVQTVPGHLAEAVVVVMRTNPFQGTGGSEWSRETR